MAKRLSRIERDIARLKEKNSEYQKQLKELESAKTCLLYTSEVGQHFVRKFRRKDL